MPGTPPLAPAAAEASLGLKLGRTAAALSVLLLGTALLLAPGAVLGNLLSTTAESVTGGGNFPAADGRCGHLTRVTVAQNGLLCRVLACWLVQLLPWVLCHRLCQSQQNSTMVLCCAAAQFVVGAVC
jgi:hypothetical protein